MMGLMILKLDRDTVLLLIESIGGDRQRVVDYEVNVLEQENGAARAAISWREMRHDTAGKDVRIRSEMVYVEQYVGEREWVSSSGTGDYSERDESS